MQSLKETLNLQKDEVLDATFMSTKALRSFIEEQIIDVILEDMMSYEETAQEFSLPYHEIRTFRGAIFAHFQMLHKLGLGTTK